jgi:hypothetical protein
MIFIIDKDGYSLCKDKHFRQVPYFGVKSYCVKTYERIANAKRAALTFAAFVVSVPDTMHFNNSGTLIEIKPVDGWRPGYVNYITHNVKEFIVFPLTPAPVCVPV